MSNKDFYTPLSINVANTLIANSSQLTFGALTVNTTTVVANTLIVGSGSINSTSYPGTANNANNLGGTTLATIQGWITGNAASYASNAYSNAVAAATSNTTWANVTVTNVLTVDGNQTGTLLTNTASLGAIAVVSTSNTAGAFVSFNRQGSYASYFGIDTDNNWTFGGWSAGTGMAPVKVGSLGVGTSSSGLTGEIRATNNITAYYSDIRLKTNIKPIENALDKVNQISGVTFNNNEIANKYGYTDKEEQVGVIAQEIQKVLPHVVKPAPFDTRWVEGEGLVSKSGENYITVQYDKIVPLLIEAIKELTARVEALESKKSRKLKVTPEVGN